MPTDTVTEGALRRDLAVAYQLAARRAWNDTCGRISRWPWRMPNGWAMAAYPKAKTNGPPCGVNCKRLLNPFVFLQEIYHAHHPC